MRHRQKHVAEGDRMIAKQKLRQAAQHTELWVCTRNIRGHPPPTAPSAAPRSWTNSNTCGRLGQPRGGMAQSDGTHKIPPGDPVPRRDRSLRERFLDCLRSAKGGGGIDGITAAETIIISSRMVFLGRELHELWEDTLSNIRTIDGNLIDYLGVSARRASGRLNLAHVHWSTARRNGAT